MVRIIGIDPSLTSTGVAELIADAKGVRINTFRFESTPPKRTKGDKTPATIAERQKRLHRIATDVTGIAHFHPRAYTWHLDYPDLAIIEAPSYASAGAGTWDRAGLWWLIVDKLRSLKTPIVIVPPKTRALWATGSGAAGKSPIAVHLSRMWPDIDLGISDDEWDAVALASMGGQYMGALPVDLARHREQLAKVPWPDFPAPVEQAS